jgi:predicted glycosyltransferase
VAVERAAPDYRARLRTCAVSVNLCGYNTAVDLMQAGPPAVLIPNAARDEREQTLRARALAAASAQFEVLPMGSLSASSLAAAVDRAAARGRGAPVAVDLSGAATAARLILSQE